MEIKVCEVCGKTSKETKYIYNTTISGEKRTYCSKHYQLVRKYGREYSLHDVKKERVCSVCGVSNKESSINTTVHLGEKIDLCILHYGRLYETGSFHARPKENLIVDKGTFAEIELYDIKGSYVDKALVSINMVPLVRDTKWYRVEGDKTFYVYGNREGVRIGLHQLIAEELYGECPEGMSVEHKNRKGLDNRNENIRYATYSEQVVNRALPTNKAGYAGVDYNAKTGRWRARLQFKGLSRTKLFDSLAEAIAQRQEWEETRNRGEWFTNGD